MKLDAPAIDRLIRLGTIGCVVIALAVAWQPIHRGALNLLFLASVFGTWCGGLYLTARYRWLQRGLLLLPLAVATLWLLPGRHPDSDRLRERYLEHLLSFEGTRYLWGGEGRAGIDCSGLPRKALRSALWHEAGSNLNAEAARAALEQWWFDTSALAMSQGYRGFTEPLNGPAVFHETDVGSLLPGDLAVTLDGVHVLVYLGSDEWIQADPAAQRVFRHATDAPNNPWSHVEVTFHRWALMNSERLHAGFLPRLLQREERDG